MRTGLTPGRPAGVLRAPVFHVGGLARFSTVDWPGVMTATVFAQGCGWRCRFCHNPHLMPFRARFHGEGYDATGSDKSARPATAPEAAAEPEEDWSWSCVLAWLRDRRGLLDGVVFSGGEPTLQAGLRTAVAQTRELGFRVGLHTGGPAPAALAEVLPLIDWVGFDFKAPFGAYGRITGRPADEAVATSLRLLRASGVACEVRTTWHPALLSEADLGAMADTLIAAGVSEWVLQRFRPEGCADAGLRDAVIGEVPVAVTRCEGLRVRVR